MPQSLTSREVTELVARQLESHGSFSNFHGISADNVRTFLVEPYETIVDPDDDESPPRPMWVVLRTHKRPESGYSVVYDPEHECWGVAETTSSSEYILVISASTFAEALSGM